MFEDLTDLPHNLYADTDRFNNLSNTRDFFYNCTSQYSDC